MPSVAVRFTAADGRCAITDRADPITFSVPVPEGDRLEMFHAAMGEVVRVRSMSPRPFPDLAGVDLRLVPEPPADARPHLAAVPDLQESP